MKFLPIIAAAAVSQVQAIDNLYQAKTFMIGLFNRLLKNESAADQKAVDDCIWDKIDFSTKNRIQQIQNYADNQDLISYVKAIEISIDMFGSQIQNLNSCDNQVQNAYYLTNWFAPINSIVKATATLTKCVSSGGNYLLTAGNQMDYYLLNDQWDDAGAAYGDVLVVCLGEVPIPGKTNLFLF